MTKTSSVQGIKAAIASETITGGGLAHYTEDLDRIMRSHAMPGEALAGAPYISPLHDDDNAPRKALKWILGRVPPLRGVLDRMRKRGRGNAWPQAAAWAALWRSRPPEMIALVPHVVIHDGGCLDDYYAAIAEHPFVLVIHDLHALHFPQEWSPADVETLKVRFTMLSRLAGQIIVHNQFTADDVVEKLGVDRERITVVLLPAFFKETDFKSSPDVDRAQLARLRIRQPYALWASSNTFVHKNHVRLIRAWRALAERGHTLQLVCTGSRGPHWAEIEALIKTEKLESLVHFTGIVADRDLAAIMRNAQLAVCPTLFEGGGPGPAAEAALAGIPVTLSWIRQCRELFNLRMDLCTFFDPWDPEAIADAVEDILLHEGEARERAQWAKRQYPGLRSERTAGEQYWRAVRSSIPATTTPGQ